MKFCWTTITVKDLDESLRFYEEVVGLKCSRRFGAGANTEIAFLGNGETEIELLCDKVVEEVNLGKDISLGFEVESVDKMLKFVEDRGIEVLGGIIQPNSHIKFFFVKDPNGLKIQFVENK